MARGMLALHPECAVEIVLGLLDDAILSGERTRAWLWWHVLVHIEQMLAQDKAPYQMH